MRKIDYLVQIPCVTIAIVAIVLRDWFTAIYFVCFVLQSCLFFARANASDDAQKEIAELIKALDKWDIDAVRSQSKFLTIRHRARRALKFLKGDALDENDE